MIPYSLRRGRHQAVDVGWALYELGLDCILSSASSARFVHTIVNG